MAVMTKKCHYSNTSKIILFDFNSSLREEVSQSQPTCTDSLRVTERGRNLLSMCGESKQDIVLLSDANKLEV